MREARAQLPAIVRRFGRAGAQAEPIVIGASRRAEAVIMSYEQYARLVGERSWLGEGLDGEAADRGRPAEAQKVHTRSGRGRSRYRSTE
jgi:hypothetical protein